MNERCKKELRSRLVKSAAAVGLRVAPLALMAAQLAHGTIIANSFTYGTGSVSANCAMGASSCMVTPGTPGGAGAPLGGTIALGFTPSMLTSINGGTATLDLNWTGSFNTALVSGQNYSFNIYFGLADNNAVPLNWTLNLAGALNGSISGTDSSPTSTLVYMTDFGTATSSNSTTSETVDLLVSWAGGPIGNGNTFAVDVPLATSVNISLTPLTGTPEPATILVAPVLAAFAFFRRRRK